MKVFSKSTTKLECAFNYVLGNVPHNPVRFADTVGIVIERNRSSDEIGMFTI